MITSLTDEQVSKFGYYVKKWTDVGLSTDECNMDECRKFAAIAYQRGGLEAPKFCVGPFNNPIECVYAEKIAPTLINEKMTEKEANDVLLSAVESFFKGIINSTASFEDFSIVNQIYGSMDASWLSFYDYFMRECGIEDCKQLDGLMGLSSVTGWWTPLKDIAFFQHRPLAIHFDANKRIHNPNGPAIEFRGSAYCNVYAWHGLKVTKKIIDRNFTVTDIDAEKNAEVRRAMIEIYGQATYITDSNAKLVASDDWGTLYRKELEGDEPLLMVKVVNCTQEPDGSFKDYFIRVDPKAYGGKAAEVPLAAVASTWRKKDGSMVFADYNEYDPMIET